MSRSLVSASASAALILSAALVLAGCSNTPSGDTTPPAVSAPAASGAAETPEAPAVEPATGEVITGTGYAYAVPEGWGNPGPVPGFDPDSFAADLEDADGFADNVNVILSPAGKVELDDIESAGPTELESAGATDVVVEARATVAGAEAAHISAALSSEGTDYLIEQFYVNGDDQTYIVTFSYSPDVADADRSAVQDAVLASWAWS